MWLVGVVIRRYIDILIIIINFPHSTCIRSFFGSSILTSLFIFKCFFGLYIYTMQELGNEAKINNDSYKYRLPKLTLKIF